jgi:hypothetical protein
VLESPVVLDGIVFDREKFSSSLWHILPRQFELKNMTTPLSSSSLKLYLVGKAGKKNALAQPRMHELSKILDFGGLERVVLGEENMPGKHAYILVKGYFEIELASPFKAVLIGGQGQRLSLTFGSRERVRRLLVKHGNSLKLEVFQLVELLGKLYLKGVNPFVSEIELGKEERRAKANYFYALVDVADPRTARLKM